MSVQVTARITGDALIMSGIQREKLAVNTITADIMREEMDTVIAETGQNYPDELPGQRYQRTGKRYDATHVEYGRGNNQYSKSYTVKSNPTYGGRSADPYVLGDAEGRGQAAIHVGRWAVLYERMLAAMERIAVRAEEIIMGMWAR